MQIRDVLKRALQLLVASPAAIAMGVLVVLGMGQAGGYAAFLPLPSPEVLLSVASGQAPPEQLLTDLGIIRGMEQLLLASEMTIVDWLPWLAGIFLVALVVLTVALLADGVLIALAAGYAERDEADFGAALRTGWKRLGMLFLLASVPATPLLVGLIVLLAALLGLNVALFEGLIDDPTIPALIVISIGGCVLLPLALITVFLELLRRLANRPCITEETGLRESFTRAWGVLRADPQPFVLVLLAQVVIGAAISLVMTMPGLIVTLVPVLVPLVWLVNGVQRAFFSTMWTITWVDVAG